MLSKWYTIGLALITFVFLVPAVAHAQIQPPGDIWKPGYPLVPCGGFATIDETGGIGGEQPECEFGHLLMTIDNIITFVSLYLSIPIATIVFAVAGFTYITAAGNTGKIQAAHKMFSRTFVGLLIALSSFLIIHFIVSNVVTDSINSYIEGNILGE